MMKKASITAGLLLSGWPVLATSNREVDLHLNDLSPKFLRSRDINLREVAWAAPDYCSSTTGYPAELVTSLEKPPPGASFDYHTFCSEVLQSTSFTHVYTTVTGSNTITATITRTSSVTATAVVPGSSTVTELCPTPSSSMTCHLQAGYDGSKASPLQQRILAPLAGNDCHQICLRDPACKSFQTVTQNTEHFAQILCNTFGQPASNITIVSPGFDKGTFYDRDCPDLLPAGCSAPAPAVTPGPALAKRGDSLKKRAYSIPPYLMENQASILFLLPEACSCLITSALPLTTETAWHVQATYFETSTTTTTTESYTVTNHPQWSTVYKSVA